MPCAPSTAARHPGFLPQAILASSLAGKWVEARDLALQWREQAPSPASSSTPGDDGGGAVSVGLGISRPPPPTVCNTAILKAMGKAGKVDAAIAWLGDTYDAAATATAAAAAAADAAPGGGTTKDDQGVRGFVCLDHSSFMAVLSACSKAGRWGSALSVLREMDRAGVTPETVAFNTVLAGKLLRANLCVVCFFVVCIDRAIGVANEKTSESVRLKTENVSKGHDQGPCVCVCESESDSVRRRGRGRPINGLSDAKAMALEHGTRRRVGWAYSSLYLPLDRMVDVGRVLASWMKDWGSVAQGLRMKVFSSGGRKSSYRIFAFDLTLEDQLMALSGLRPQARCVRVRA